MPDMDNHIGNFVMDEGFDPYGTHKEVRFEGDQVATLYSVDVEPLLREAAAARIANRGRRWSEGMGERVGIVPMPVWAAFQEKPVVERQVALLSWLRANPAFVTFESFLK